MKDSNTIALLFLVTLLVGGCAVTRPTLVENQHLDTVGEEAARRDIESCVAEARQHLQPASVAGPTVGDVVQKGAKGAATKAAKTTVSGGDPVPGVLSSLVKTGVDGIMNLLLNPSPNTAQLDPAMQQYVDNCLCSRGYEVDGWR